MAGDFDPAWVTELYRCMLRIRAFEEKAAELYQKGELPGFLHSSVGQEAVPVGVTAWLERDDLITSTHRGHGHILAKGADPARMFLELYGSEEGYNRGKGGSMHIMDFSIGVLGANGIVGGGVPIAVGAALSLQNRGSDRVVACFFGDGAVTTGAFHEGVNMAAIWDLPVLFVCENNQYAESTPHRTVDRARDLTVRAQGYGIPGEVVDGNDLFAVLEAARRAVERARRGGGPTLLECRTYRWYGHYIGDPAVYRSEEEVASWKARDPLGRVAGWLAERGALDEEGEARLRAEVQAEIEAAAAAGARGRRPAPESALEDVYAG
ncbi:MAG: thiamine pyrophosphate-dependent dehydrogenase E1 component subunit alpha [Firmicutes bacterium]|nr:thiamine pyrophosphate-dependent dehydrogenase E1 component subunit alpha [Bacillota bacterium]